MTKRTAEDLVAEWEKTGVATVNLDELKALIASWRERGEAVAIQNGVIVSGARKLNEAREALRETRAYITDKFDVVKALLTIDAALKDKP